MVKTLRDDEITYVIKRVGPPWRRRWAVLLVGPADWDYYVAGQFMSAVLYGGIKEVRWSE